MKDASLRSLYICYFPLTEPLVQTQVIAYLEGLSRHGHQIHLLTYETSRHDPSQRRHWRQRLKAKGIIWHELRYHKYPSIPATAYDVLCGVLTGLRIMRRYRLNTIHARSHVPVAMGLILKYLTGCRLIFDIRGLLAEEYEDSGAWRRDSLAFRLTKGMERQALTRADGIVVLTNAVHKLLFGDAQASVNQVIKVIPCCANLKLIEEQQGHRLPRRRELGIEDKIVMVYAGKFGGYYMQEEMADFFSEAHRLLPNLHFLILTQSDPELIREALNKRQIALGDYQVKKVEPDAIGSYLAAADFGLSFRLPTPSQCAASPTKLGEYLAAGLPVVCNSGIGDVDEIITTANVGVLLREFETLDYKSAVERLMLLLEDNSVKQRCQQVAHSSFSLEDLGIPLYNDLYQSVAAQYKGDE